MLNKLNERFPNLVVKVDEPLAHYTYTRTGGKADLIAFPTTPEEVKFMVDFARDSNIPLTVLGNASNLIVRDGGIRGVVLILTAMKGIEISDTTVVAYSGAPLIEVSRLAGEADLTGLEFACGIPGSIGGAVYMNAGAYGGEVKDVIERVEVLTRDGNLKTLTNEECQFAYRNSALQDSGDIVLAVTFQLAQGEHDVIHAKMADLTFQRESKQPLEYPSCGSVFKRPEGYFAGKLIQDSGLQGYRIGGVEVSKKHAGFMVNIDNGTATDYINLIAHVQKIVWEQHQVKLETEVRIIGEEATQA
ncbi:UDP-N-acetylmuramate dehydrogenase [Aerococcaceae bacterium NML160702]|nr:UDP-N-acetylmuramate dehydrogenase [Aerococcaceae bacterium NML190938]MCW6675112.1 UDP-N-acetylmuramate dehydrogenase [Aerococcaceae bacterium NML171108]MCW6680483.1 UDP-N-acetylmuramate dehydrogenase [Aerococcaceae bacterium NML130460]MCW6682876.1 UDP-N-acetylmuramate dehydrogenase [Aerococcaceae bacterium NML160702]